MSERWSIGDLAKGLVEHLDGRPVSRTTWWTYASFPSTYLAETTSIMTGMQPTPVNPMAAFDAVVYVDEVTPWHTFVDAPGVSPSRRPG